MIEDHDDRDRPVPKDEDHDHAAGRPRRPAEAGGQRTMDSAARVARVRE
jgi:hypothetical protein